MADPFTALQGIGSIGAGLAGIGSGRKAAKDAKKDAKVRRSIANTAFSPIQFSGLGGSSVTFGGGTPTVGGTGGVAQPTSGEPFGFDPATGTNFDGQGRPIAGGLRQVQGGRGLKQSDLGSVNVSAGQLDPVFGGLADLSSGILGQAQGAGQIDPFTNQAFANFLGAGQAGGNTLDLLSQGAGGAFGQVGQQFGQAFANPFAQGLQDQLLGQAGNVFGNLPGTQEQARAQTLDLLRQQAQPFEERAFSNLQERQFLTGQGGTSGGALQTEAFARGLGQADLQRQLAASGEGRAAQQAQLGLGVGLSGQGQALAGLQDQLLSGATNRFGAVSNLAGNLQGQRFNQALTSLQNITLPQLLQQGVQQGALGNLGLALGAGQGISQDARANAQLVNQFMANQAAARTGAANIGIPTDTSTATAFSQLAGALAPQGGALGALRGLFGGGGGSGVSTMPVQQTSTQLGTGQDFFRPILTN